MTSLRRGNPSSLRTQIDLKQPDFLARYRAVLAELYTNSIQTTLRKIKIYIFRAKDSIFSFSLKI